MKNLLHDTMWAVEPSFSKVNFADKSVYGQWLAQQYYIVCHSTPLLALSCGRSIDNREYHNRCIEHLTEEKGHEKMLLNDLKLLGFSLSQFPELDSTRAIYQCQYYWTEHECPTSFLGYVLFLEGLAVTYGEKVYSMAQNHGSTFLKHHAGADEGHLEDAFAVIHALPENQKEKIAINLKQTASLYAAMLSELSLNNALKKAS
jgi:hypothetical protein